MKKKTICLTGYAYGNLGDDLFFKIICERYKDTDFYIQGMYQYAHFYSTIENLKYIPLNTRTIKRFIYYRCKSIGIEIPSLLYPPKAHAHVKIGGSMFMEADGWYETYEHHLDFLKHFEKNYVLGANFGPYTQEAFFEQYKHYFSKLDDICFRDTSSANLFKDLSQVRQAEDIVFQLNYPQGEEENYYVVSPIYCKNRIHLKEYHDTYMQKLVTIIDKLTEKNSEVVLMGFCEFEKDTLAIEELYAKVKNTTKVRIYNHNNIEQSLHILAHAKGIIATRFHAMILGFVFQKPTIPLIYSEKMRTVLQDMKYPGISYDIQNMENVDNLELIQHLENKIEFDVAPIRKSAEKHFQKLDAFITN